MFAEKASQLVQFVYSVHLRRSEDPDWEDKVVCTGSSERRLDDRIKHMTERDIGEASIGQDRGQSWLSSSSETAGWSSGGRQEETSW